MYIIIAILSAVLMYAVYEYFQFKKASRPHAVRVATITRTGKLNTIITDYDDTKSMVFVGDHAYNMVQEYCIDTRVWHGLVQVPTLYVHEGNPNPLNMRNTDAVVEMDSAKIKKALRTHVAQDLIDAFKPETISTMMATVITVGAVGLCAYGVYYAINAKLDTIVIALSGA